MSGYLGGRGGPTDEEVLGGIGGGSVEQVLEGGKTAVEVSLGTVRGEAVSSAINWSSRTLVCSRLLISRCSLSYREP